MYGRGHEEGTRKQTASQGDWYKAIAIANIQAVDDYATFQAREDAAMFRTHLAAERATLLQAQEDATAQDDAERALVTALARQVGNAIAAIPEAAERIRKAARLVQSRQVWSLTGGNFLVGSDSSNTGAYLVTRGGGWACECGDYRGRKRICKHQIAAMLTVKMGAAYTPSY